MKTDPNIIPLVFFGTPSLVVPILQKLTEHFQVQGVVTAPDKPVGRKQILTSSPVAETAQKYGIPVLKPEKLDEEFIKNHLPFLNADLYIVAAYGKILPQQLFNIPRLGALNVHPSLLPKYRGSSPIPAAILNGDKVSGITIIKMDAKMDHGPILYTKEIRMSDQDTFDSLSIKMFEEAAEILIEVIPQYIKGKLTLKEQNHQAATFTKLITKKDGFFEITNPPSLDKLDRMIRAYYPWPTAWTRWNNKVVKFLPEGLVQMEGKKPVKLEEFLRGYPNFPLKEL
ncbi:MAG: Methionyl-tRNA formyltransferase [Candidatus Daviesbacteria bacterium GW2011_GWA1_41_61]|uniref:Methionyl-tRNA formyltransferase n=1 Tax=Candidatus Daviesbacteria bacterium GW2011_GWA2_40_9 TaxID=1618424 RepID=A0A0G0WD46_9BACT|nr:MAG: methionyl-tRNA formyltransferase, methionyl-tRNA formyltransferase [Candidatus Daviesbacteria bacterium GW2011_GWC1_40_9]KKR82180.1 MAG: Methionyl-tRNA formyltransferase [Candidatus Daviesbacteria bacterium GW2011_GWA2_40_9]KKR93628.1 MAG: Methionyl-tRNA formyltransferase [Candidatus Daviesbacteria bacterium GW2011_GWB1_41_15]KKS14821.1 MAG: Methionyl-tRNA formyltransferase [Candidatus Daviesbacteria bacterium GW2011_GWA1_41_61]